MIRKRVEKNIEKSSKKTSKMKLKTIKKTLKNRVGKKVGKRSRSDIRLWASKAPCRHTTSYRIIMILNKASLFGREISEGDLQRSSERTNQREEFRGVQKGEFRGVQKGEFREANLSKSNTPGALKGPERIRRLFGAQKRPGGSQKSFLRGSEKQSKF